MQKVFVSWSGGKDSCHACYLATKQGLKVSYLANMITEDGKISWSHRMPAWALQLQSQALGIPLLQQKTDQANYESEFKNMLRTLKKEGVTGGVFGDIDFNEHRKWIADNCGAVEVKYFLPLWELPQGKIIRDFVDTGFETVIVVAKSDLIDGKWVGKKVDKDFIAYLEENNVSPCGEGGEYHTFVVNGPLFKKRIEIQEAEKVQSEGRWFFEIKKCRLVDK